MNYPSTMLKVIIIEDDQFQLKLLSHQLSMVGKVAVTAFADEQTAIDRMAEENLDFTVVIVDLDMPSVDSLSFLQKLKEANFTGAILLISSIKDERAKAAADLAGFFNLTVLGHLLKPVQQDKLKRFLRDFFNQRQSTIEDKQEHRYTVERVTQAIEAGELYNVYQPKVLLSTGELVGVEALVRWEHPEDGFVLPDQFIGLAEDNSLIDKIARIVVRNALQDNEHWAHLGKEVTVAVNISMYNLNTREFVGYIESELATSGVRPENLTLEVTESKLVQDYSMVLDMLTRLRLRRVNLSIDDFGTGKSSMAQLRDIPFNELKIDRDFVHTAHENAQRHNIVDGSMQVAKQLGIKTVAEGVEDEADWNYLGGTGCDLAQGYFIGKPMKAEELAAWQTQWSQRYDEIVS